MKAENSREAGVPAQIQDWREERYERNIKGGRGNQGECERGGKMPAGYLHRGKGWGRKIKASEKDTIHMTFPRVGAYYVIRVDDTMEEALVYITQREWVYEIPFEEKKEAYNPRSFAGSLTNFP